MKFNEFNYLIFPYKVGLIIYDKWDNSEAIIEVIRYGGCVLKLKNRLENHSFRYIKEFYDIKKI